MSRRVLDERGLTLTELTIVGVLAALTMMSLVGFYMSAQSLWAEASTQAITQREATNVVSAITSGVHASAQAFVSPATGGDSSLCQLQLVPAGGGLPHYYWWSATDSLIHEGTDPGDPLQDRGPMLSSKVERFELSADTALVTIVGFRVRTAPGHEVELSASAGLLNR